MVHVPVQSLTRMSLLLTSVSGFLVSPPTVVTSSTELSMGFGFSLPNSIFDLPEDGMHPRRSGPQQQPQQSSSQQEEEEEEENEDSSPFLQGDSLHLHRRLILSLRNALAAARRQNNTPAIRRLSRRILDTQSRDAEFCYAAALERYEKDPQPALQAQAQHARQYIPQFQLEGLWVGKYGDTFQMVNVSYVGDVLVAHKITTGRQQQQQHVPKGQVSFHVDLQPHQQHQYEQQQLPPIELYPAAAAQWGARFLQRHAGRGQVAAPGYQQSQWLPGQLILVNKDYFSFAWLETGHQVFFGRPSPELTLKLLRQEEEQQQYSSSSADVVQQRGYLERCLEETEMIQDEMEVQDGLFQSHDQEFYYQLEGCFD